ncbi:hypothetical protein ACH5RR_041465 [Cinchona calisaya]|uniref:TPX2 central domain-containing protein n=1 Tax=Cinchona calisaya TaxID=153742 RepID=A0ABD2XUD0_9GENT
MDEMDEEMEESTEVVEYTFTAVEIDFDYEFDAVRYFDFSREESLAEARQAELWFDTAATYPPSPFVARLLPGKDVLLENVNISPKSKQEEDANLLGSDSDTEVDEQNSVDDRDDGGKQCTHRGTSSNFQSGNPQKFQNQRQHLPLGLTFYNYMMEANSNAKTKSIMQPYVPRTSTLMKPTASQLAKQNRTRIHAFRLQKALNDKNEKSSTNSCGIEIQAAKRQKLERGHLSKVSDTKQQVNFVHKEPKRNGTVDGNSMQAKLRRTVPREPDLETTHRAQRIRPKIGKGTQSSTSTVRRFKALPLNRKILEAPSLISKRSAPRVPEFREFHLKTSERALQHAATGSVSAASCSNSNKELPKYNRNSTAQCRDETRGCNVLDTSKVQGSELSHNFKALPLNRKIFSSKGDIGVFRNVKRDVTVPKEFNFHTDKRAQHNPPVELFSKLSIASEPQPKIKLPHPASLHAKGSKENRWDSFKQEHQVKHEGKEKLPLNEARKIQFSSNGRETDGGLVSGISSGILHYSIRQSQSDKDVAQVLYSNLIPYCQGHLGVVCQTKAWSNMEINNIDIIVDCERKSQCEALADAAYLMVAIDTVVIEKMSSMRDNTNATTASSCPDLSSSSNPSGPSQSSSKVDKGKAAIPSLAPKDSKVTTTAGGKVRSWVWEHFEKIPCEDKNNQKATYNYCGAIISCPTKTGTSALSNHYGVAMNMEYTEYSSLGNASLVGNLWYNVTKTTR